MVGYKESEYRVKLEPTLLIQSCTLNLVVFQFWASEKSAQSKNKQGSSFKCKSGLNET